MNGLTKVIATRSRQKHAVLGPPAEMPFLWSLG